MFPSWKWLKDIKEKIVELKQLGVAFNITRFWNDISLWTNIHLASKLYFCFWKCLSFENVSIMFRKCLQIFLITIEHSFGDTKMFAFENVLTVFCKYSSYVFKYLWMGYYSLISTQFSNIFKAFSFRFLKALKNIFNKIWYSFQNVSYC